MDKIKRDVDSGVLIRLTRGLYETNSGAELCFLASLIFSPSYLRLIKDVFSYVEIKCSVKRNKAIGNNKIVPTKTMITKDNRSFRELLEILRQQTKIECLENLEVYKNLLKDIKIHT